MEVSLIHGRPIVSLRLEHLLISFGWNLQESAAGIQTDCAIFLLDSDDSVSSEDDLIFYNNSEHVSGCVQHLGIPNASDNVEQFKIDLSKIPAQVEKLKIITSIYDAQLRNQNFSMIKNAYLILDDLDSKQKLRKIDFDPNISAHTIEIGEIYRFKGIWRFRETWNSYRSELAEACEKFGIRTEQSESIVVDDYWSISWMD